MSDAASDDSLSVRGNPSMIPAAPSAAPEASTATSVAAAAGGAPPDAPHAPVGPANPGPLPPREPIDVTPAPVGVDPAPQPKTRAERVAWLQNHLADLEGEVRRGVQELERLHGGVENPHSYAFVTIRNALSQLVDLARKLRP